MRPVQLTRTPHSSRPSEAASTWKWCAITGKNSPLFERLIDRGIYRVIEDFSSGFNQKRSGGTFSLTNVKTISDIALLLKYASAKLPLEDFWAEFKGDLSPLELLDISVGQAIDELSRPIDAIRHQAKTVTVGTSRKEEFLRGIVFDLLVQLGFSAKNLTSKNIILLHQIQKAISRSGGTRFIRFITLTRRENRQTHPRSPYARGEGFPWG